MIEEVKTDNNCIVKAFENNPISIIEEDLDNKKIYYFKASDVGKALNLSNIAVSIQSYDEDERVIRKAYDTSNREQDTIFLTSRGVYRLLYSSKKEMQKNNFTENEDYKNYVFNLKIIYYKMLYTVYNTNKNDRRNKNR